MVNSEEIELIKEYQQGDTVSFNRLIKNYQPKIYAHARRMFGNHMDADEVTQEVLIVLYKKLGEFRFESALSTWVYRITSNKCINHLNKKKVKRFLFLDDDEAKELQHNQDVVNDFEDREKLAKLDNVLQKLPAKQREVFILRNFEELSYDEISEVTGKSVGGLKANYYHALKKVTELMQDE